MLAFRSLIAALLGACVLLLARLETAPRVYVITSTPQREASIPVTEVDTPCYDCGSGSGPSDESLASLVRLTPDEEVVAVGSPVRGDVQDALATWHHGYGHSHGEEIDLEIKGRTGSRRVLLMLR